MSTAGYRARAGTGRCGLIGKKDSSPVPRLEAVFSSSDDFWRFLHPEPGTVAPLRFGQRLVTAPAQHPAEWAVA